MFFLMKNIKSFVEKDKIKKFFKFGSIQFKKSMLYLTSLKIIITRRNENE